MGKRFIAFLLVVFFWSCLKVAGAYSDDQVAVTSVHISTTPAGETTAEVVVNNAVLIREIKFSQKEGNLELEFPAYVARTGRKYPQVRVLSKDAWRVIREAISAGKLASADRQYTIKYRITKFLPYNRPSSVKVFCAVTINEAIEIECRVMEGNYGPWIAWPARKSEESSTYIKQVVILNQQLRQAIEKVLLKKYRDLLRERSSQILEDY